MRDETLVIHGENVQSRIVGDAAFVVHLSVVHLVDSFESPRLVILRLHLNRRKSISITNCCSPTSVADETELDAFVTRSSSTSSSWGTSRREIGAMALEEYRITEFGSEELAENGAPLGQYLPTPWRIMDDRLRFLLQKFESRSRARRAAQPLGENLNRPKSGWMTSATVVFASLMTCCLLKAQIPDQWRSSRTILLHKKGSEKIFENIVLFDCWAWLTSTSQRLLYSTLDEGQPVEQTGFH